MNGLAIRSLICGIASIPLGWAIVPNIAAISYGILGRRLCNRDYRYSGSRMAIAGVILGSLTLAAWTLLLLLLWGLSQAEWED
jgi:hypothetical protein